MKKKAKTLLPRLSMCLLALGLTARPMWGQDSTQATTNVSPQTGTYLPLETAVEQAIARNSHVKQAELTQRIAHAEYLQTDAIFLPQVSLGYTAVATNNPLNAFGFLLQQSRVTQADFDPTRLNDPGTAYNYGASAQVQMPLVNMDLLYARKGAKMREEVMHQQTSYTKQHIRYEVQKAYTQLQFAHTASRILTQTLSDVKAIRQSVENFYLQGLIQKSDVLNADVQVNTIESALAKARSNVSNASEGLRLLMNDALGQDDGQDITPAPLQQLDRMHERPVFTTLRADIQAMQRAVDASQMMVKSQKMKFLPRLNAFGTYQFNDKKIFQFKSDSYTAGLSLSWDIYAGQQHINRLRTATLQQEEMKLKLQQHIDQSRLEADKTQRDLDDLLFEIRQHDTSVQQAEEALRITQNRHREGLVSTNDLLQAQAQYSKQQLERAQAIMNYNIKRYYQALLTTIH